MARVVRRITCKRPDEAILPSRLSEGVALVMKQEASGLLEKVSQWLKINRQGGYPALDIYLFLLLYFTSDAGGSLKVFWEWVRGSGERLAALAGRRSLPSASAVSRALSAVEAPLLREASHALLLRTSAALEVLSHPCVQHLDAWGQPWQVFDLDPTVTPLRQRQLPEREDLPEPRRRAADLGLPGHTGRKRGELVFRRMAVQHSGSGLWIHCHLSPGNGEGVLDFEPALESIVATCEAIAQPLERTFVRMDGEFGTVPFIATCQARKVPFLTRLNRAPLYEAPELLRALRSASWTLVPDSLSGPRRGAADLGILTLEPGKKTRRPDGSRYEPVTVRLIASRFPKTGAAGRGRVLDGFQIELFVTDLDGRAWPAEQAVAAYFARSAQENRFAQEDRELGLDHAFSQHLPGQELVCLVALALWNIRIAEGFALEPPPDLPRVPTLEAQRPGVRDERADALWPRDPVLAKLLAPLDWPVLLKERPDWRFEPHNGTLLCDQDRALALTCVHVDAGADGLTRLIFRRPKGGCEACGSRARCLHSSRPFASKHVTVPVPAELAEQVRHRLAKVRGAFKSEVTLASPTPTPTPGPLMAQEPLFLPAEARRAFAQLHQGVTLRVEVQKPPPVPRPRLVALTHARRQRRRCTWAENVDRYALQDGAVVHVECKGGHRLLQWLEGEAGAERPGESIA